MRPSRILPAAAALLAGPISAAAAQDDFTSYFALNSTPIGALPPVAPTSVAGATPAYTLRYGRLPFGGRAGELHSVGLHLDRAAGAGRLGGTLGWQFCDGCDGVLMAGVDLLYPIRATSSSGTERSVGIGVALAPSFGIGLPLRGEGVIASAAVALPVSVAVPVGRRARLVPFVAPGFGLGLVAASEGAGAGGVSPLVGGGVELTGGDGFGVSAGFQKVFVADGETQIGAGVSWRPARASR